MLMKIIYSHAVSYLPYQCFSSNIILMCYGSSPYFPFIDKLPCAAILKLVLLPTSLHGLARQGFKDILYIIYLYFYLTFQVANGCKETPPICNIDDTNHIKVGWSTKK
ncbi:hypothetical protein QJS04_geneDACA002940 [Acorus gramineus]|uniref:Uncharacterized protein n=1 Tax=Acorus gramineus TaxID=55184 RepID=A0AAV9BT03_ACOGR|nr:hypothetical protein QJS04_geneDACA002940 [Acorus gramineus]